MPLPFRVQGTLNFPASLKKKKALTSVSMATTTNTTQSAPFDEAKGDTGGF